MISRKYLLVLGLAAACSGEQAASGDSAATSAGTASQAGAAQGGDDDLRDITAYRLTMGKIDRWMAAQRNVALAAARMSPAEREAMKAAGDADDESSNGNESLDEMARRIESHPVLAKAVRDAGLSPREFAVISMAYLQSGMAAAVLKMRPNDNQDSLVREMKANLDNVRFVQENEAVLTQKQQAIQAELKAAGVDDDDSGSSDDTEP